jgi:hypothetical protein
MLIPLTTEQQQWADTTLNAMTLPQCVGQLLCAFSPRFTTDDWLNLLKKVPIGALAVRGASSASLREQMHALQDQSAVPLLVSADLEHGAAYVPNPLTTYGNSDVSQRAVVKVWLGEIEAQGNCPVGLPKITIQPLSG